MKRSIILAACLLSLTVPAAQEDIVWAQTAPVMTSLSATTLPRSGRLIIQGSGFGAAQGSGSVEIGGAPAIVTRWAGTSITAYVPEAAPLGTVAVQVLTGGNASNTLPLSVAVRQQNGVVKWQFQADSDYILQRPALSPDGTIVVHDSGGFVYSLQPDGALKWVFKTPAFAYGPPTVGADGSIYVASLDTIYALDSAGNLKWQFSDPGSQGAIAGPTVGPDGNIYVVNDLNGLGGFALSPNGQLLWSNVGNPVMYEYGQIGAEIVFGPSVPGGPVNRFYVAFDPRLDPHRWAFDQNGLQKWSTTTGVQAYPLALVHAPLAVGPNGTVYH
ncbi:MAG: PQQ-binding-like beta-propeller repeat protein, partial [Candidatus Rokubacteria bacterium]|nr:PQQ-binding-like beta-propeller repeat protein [Candidatus Rokubacteria bacterium]